MTAAATAAKVEESSESRSADRTAASKTPAYPLAKEPPAPQDTPSPQMVDARRKREAFGHLVDALENNQRGGAFATIRRPGAALFVAFVVTDLGTKAASAMKAADILRHADSFRLHHPLAWGAACKADETRFAQFLKIGGLAKFEGATAEETERARQTFCLELHQLRSILAAPNGVGLSAG